MTAYNSPPLSEATGAELVRLFSDARSQHRIAHASVYRHINKRWPNGLDPDEHKSNHIQASRAVAALPLHFGLDAQGHPVACKFIWPHAKSLPSEGYLPYFYFDRELAEVPGFAAAVNGPFHVADNGRGDLKIKQSFPGQDGRHKNVPGRRIVAQYLLAETGHPMPQSLLLLNGNPGDLRWLNFAAAWQLPAEAPPKRLFVLGKHELEIA